MHIYSELSCSETTNSQRGIATQWIFFYAFICKGVKLFLQAFPHNIISRLTTSDLSEAFDKIDHTISMQRLIQLSVGVKQALAAWYGCVVLWLALTRGSATRTGMRWVGVSLGTFPDPFIFFVVMTVLTVTLTTNEILWIISTWSTPACCNVGSLEMSLFLSLLSVEISVFGERDLSLDFSSQGFFHVFGLSESFLGEFFSWLLWRFRLVIGAKL